ncbi:lysophospholipid acyltransferase 7 [Neocloeon triangulifer]|uniref:lysophospholipid acyltransferase 7 n=1 Tax=Neocloeon triangulifer TaxID=2078957 RepID=UPI00286EE1BD|nr:lysophospholipid acyltransferase 7 [Neocloeon triangulifer]
MNSDDIIYIVLLLFAIGFGHILRQIEDPLQRKWAASAVGFMIMLIPSGLHIVHPIICIVVNAAFIVYGDKMKCHLYSFAFTFIYLAFFRTTVYFGISYPPGHTNLIQMMLTLKLVGLAFEVHDTQKAMKSSKDKHEFLRVQPDLADVFHYSFCYIGVLAGPFYRYRTYYDLMHGSYWKNVNCTQHMLKRVIIAPMAAFTFYVLSQMYPWDYGLSDEFVYERSLVYRILYMLPSFVTFRMRIMTGMILSECACIMAGLGAYPVSTRPRTGTGPQDYTKLLELDEHPQQLKKEEYNFATVYNVEPWGVEFSPTVREGMHCWNTTVQYWLAINVYKRVTNKSFRTAATMFISSYWHGVYIGYYLCLGSVPFYLPVEDIYDKLYRQPYTGAKRKIINWIFWIPRVFAFSYMSLPFIYLYPDKIIRNWGAIYFMGHVVSILAYIIGIGLRKIYRKSSSDPHHKDSNREKVHSKAE